MQTFFSTDIIKYQDPNGGRPGNGTYSSVAMKRWLQVTLPLTVITLLGAFTAKVLADHRRSNLEAPGGKWKQNEKRERRQPPYTAVARYACSPRATVVDRPGTELAPRTRHNAKTSERRALRRRKTTKSSATPTQVHTRTPKRQKLYVCFYYVSLVMLDTV